MKVGTISKHFAAHTGPESPNNELDVGRMAFDTVVSQRALHSHFLKPFKARTSNLLFILGSILRNCLLVIITGSSRGWYNRFHVLVQRYAFATFQCFSERPKH